MRNSWLVSLLLTAGCVTPPAPQTQRVPADPFVDPRNLPISQTRASYAPASQDTQERVEIMRGKLLGVGTDSGKTPYIVELFAGKSTPEKPQAGMRLDVSAINSPDPEIFHTSSKQIYITEGLVRQCQTDGQLAAVLANEMGRIISEREAAARQEVRQAAPPPPVQMPIAGNGYSREIDLTSAAEMGNYEKRYPKETKRLPPPNPQQIARTILESAGFQRTELDAAAPLLQNADRYRSLENQLKGNAKQSDWKPQ